MKKLKIALSLETLKKYGLETCKCGHPENNHFSLTSNKVCARCDCRKYKFTLREGTIIK
jgi:hypothetical protein